ncbi:Sjogren's syndrome/scleroderma autoantigen 1 family protein [Haloplanus salilacus]|uniref:Sjogren's syndrome/scleroderma autoantigen 1 family protein n=1 Tax=Haloplanus salilacus TaxID=2949994 RepID=UPI0030D5835D
MSGFDKEAERERLREKYERDQEKRAATQRMSELLLKGATMTNSHCDTCGDPIFRHDGRAFCPTCRGEGDAAGDAGTGATEPDDTAEADAQADTDSSPGQSAESTDGPTPDESATPVESSTPDARATDADVATSGSRRAPSSTDTERSPTPATGTRGRGYDSDGATADVPAQRSSDPDADPVGTARASLSRTLVRYARAAEDADDPRRAAELLGAAHEAAETLAALDPVR